MQQTGAKPSCRFGLHATGDPDHIAAPLDLEHRRRLQKSCDTRRMCAGFRHMHHVQVRVAAFASVWIIRIECKT